MAATGLLSSTVAIFSFASSFPTSVKSRI